MSTLERVRLESDTATDVAPGLRPSDADALSRRELVVLSQLVAGGTLGEIAASLWVTRNTVKSQVRSLYRKIGVSNRVEAVAWAESVGLSEPVQTL